MAKFNPRNAKGVGGKVKGQKNKKQYENGVTRLMSPPAKYQQNFLQKLDMRTESYALLNDAYQAVLADMGGTEHLPHTMLTLIERFCFLEFQLRRLEVDITTKTKGRTKKFQRWLQGVNTLMGLARTLGLERKAKSVLNLKDYVNAEKTGKPKKKRKVI